MFRNRSLLPVFTLLAIALGLLPALADGTNDPFLPPFDADDFSPLLGLLALFLALVMVVVFVFLLAVGLVACVVLCALAGALAALGILSTSVAVGFIRRSPASGFRALFLQLGAVIGVPCGIGAAWLVSWLVGGDWSITARLLVGGTGGLVCGILVAWLFNLVWSKLAEWILARHDQRNPKAEPISR